MKRGRIRGKSLQDLSRTLLSAVKSVVSAFHPLTLTGLLCLLGYILTCVILGLRLRRDIEDGINKHTLAMHISSLFTFMSVPISFYLIYDHLSHFFQPKLQIQIIRIILIVPIFAFESSLSIHFMDYAFWFQCFREFYESYVMYSFMLFLLYYLGDTEKIVQSLATKSSSLGVHKQPFCCISTWTMGHQFLTGCKTGVLQYVLNRFVLTSMSVVLHAAGLYVEGDYSLDSPYLYLTLINSLSQTYALYALFMFYYASSAEFKSIRPFEKFLSIKLIIFFSWWQGIIIGFLVNGAQLENNNFSYDHAVGQPPYTIAGALDEGLIFARKINSGMTADQHTTQHMADGIQDLLICMEMLFAAVAFTYSFPVADFAVHGHDGTTPARRDKTAAGSMTNAYATTPVGLSGIRRRGGQLSYDHEYTGSGSLPGSLLQDVGVSEDLSTMEDGSHLQQQHQREEEELDAGLDATERRITMLAQEGPAGDMKYTHSPLLSHSMSLTFTSSPVPLPSLPTRKYDQLALPSPTYTLGEDGDSSSATSDSRSCTNHCPVNYSSGKSEQLQQEVQGVRKSLSSNSLCSRDSSDSSRGRGHLHSHSSQLSPRKLRGTDRRNDRKYKWKDRSSKSLYTHNNLITKSTLRNGPQVTDPLSSRPALQRCWLLLLACPTTCLVCSSSLAYYFSSFFFKQEDDTGSFSVEDSSNNHRQHHLQGRHDGSASTSNTDGLFSKTTTPKKFYDYFYYHAAPVDEQLQQSGQFSLLQAIYLTLAVGELREDMLELSTHLLDILIINPSLQLKRWIKSKAGAAHLNV